MTTVSKTKHKGSDGKTLYTTTTQYNNGSSKSVTKTAGNVLFGGKIVKTSSSDGKGKR